MKGVILAGGLGSRLDPLTKATNKHLLPVYDRPMIYYPIQTLRQAGIDEIMIIVSGPHAGDFIPILKNGEEFGLRSIHYGYQWRPDGGIADALGIAREFVGTDDVCVVLGDNTTDADISFAVNNFGYNRTDGVILIGEQKPHAHIFLKEVSDPQRYGIAEVSEILDGNGNKTIKSIEEKPKNPKSSLAVTGLYIYDKHVFDFIDKCEVSGRGELEITDVNNFYLEEGVLTHSMLEGFWKDAGTFDSLYEANKYYAEK